MAAAAPYRFSAVVVAVCLLSAVCGVCNAESPATPILTYFNMKGRAEPIRLAFQIGGIDFVDKRLSFNDFYRVKGRYPLGQLPVLQLGNEVYTESRAILVYAGRRAGLMPDNEVEELKVNQIVDALYGVVEESVKVFHKTDARKKQTLAKTLIEETIPRYMRAINGMVRKATPGFAVGNQLTIADIGLYSVMNLILEDGASIGITSDFFSRSAYYREIQRVYEAVASNPKVKEWEKKPHPMM